jgi:glycosyltransferase involved in cell wall biosynthesis
VIAQAFSFGLPVIASRLGSLSEIVNDEINGLLFEAGNSQDLAQKVGILINRPDLDRMRQNAHQSFMEKYSAERNYEFLKKIYEKVLSKN